jgi:hypothetical protein
VHVPREPLNCHACRLSVAALDPALSSMGLARAPAGQASARLGAARG